MWNTLQELAPRMKLRGLQMWFVLIFHYYVDVDDDYDDDKHYGDIVASLVMWLHCLQTWFVLMRMTMNKAVLIVHHFIMASLAKSLQGFQMWFVLIIMVFVMMMMNYSGEDVDPSLLVHDDD